MNTPMRTLLVLFSATLVACTDFTISQPGGAGGSGASPSTSGETTGGGAVPCAPGTHRCAEACLDDHDISSCGASCTPCFAPPNAKSTCDGISCAVACIPGYADCDGEAANGCEADLSSGVTCGACATACDGSTPFCKEGTCSSDCGAPPVVACGASCVDISADPHHCGGCDTACPADSHGTAICLAGVCGVTCDAGHHACGGVCVSDGSVTACGASCAPCPVPVGGTATCDGGSCGIACSAGHADCDMNAMNGCEAKLSSAASCGSCGTVCSGVTPVCNDSGAGFACADACGGATPTLCGASCVNTASDPNNCGVCGKVCPGEANGTPTCSGGTCAQVCDAGYHDCGGACVSNMSVASCGASCSPCAAPANGTSTCNGSSCGVACSTNYANCDGAIANGCEADLSQPSSCDNCWTVCSGATPLCKYAAGVFSCASACSGATPTLCGASCVDTMNDPSHCGACNNACPAPPGGTATCTGGVCGHTCNAGFQPCGAACTSSLGAACPTGLLGVCAAGTKACSAGSVVCNPDQQAIAEICDGLDNDCDGQVDDSCCDPKVGTHGQVPMWQQANAAWAFHDVWCSIPWNLPPQCVQGNYTYSQSLVGGTCIQVPRGGTCTDPSAQYSVICVGSVDCVYDCNGVCNPTGAGC